MNNVFTVDLGSLDLTDDQRESINRSIHKAVTTELASIIPGDDIFIVPVNRWKPGFPSSGGNIINGIIIDKMSSDKFEKIKEFKENNLKLG